MAIKNIKGEIMPASNRGRTRTRLSLLAGSSLAAAGLVISGAALAPTTAAAQQATCVSVPAPTGNGTNAVTVATGTYNPGVTCVFTGAGATVSTAGAVTVGSTAGGDGVNLSATGADTVTWVSTAGTVTGGAQNVGPVIDATSVSGAISITTAAVTGTTIQNTYGVQAVSSGGGAVSVTNTTGAVNVGSSTVGAQQQSAIRAVSTGGAGAVTVSTAGAVAGRVRGIEAQASGTGALTVTSTGAVTMNNTAGVGLAAIDARTGTGLLTVNINAGAGAINGQSGAAILANAGGAASINIAAGRTAQATTASTGALNLTSAGTTTVTNAGTITGGAANGVAVRAAGGGLTLNSTGVLTGRLELGSVTGAVVATNGGSWATSGASNLGAGASTLANGGTLTVSGASTFTGLETFNNAGRIALGANTLAVAGTTFTGSAASLLTLTTTLDPAGATACGTAIAGCLDLTGGTTAGVTGVAVTVSGDQDVTRFSTKPIVLVDVGGGVSAGGHFVLDEASTGYSRDRLLGGVMGSRSLFGFTLRYNADTQTHALISAPRADAFEFAPVIHEVLSTWHTTADVVAGRQADLAAGANGGMWIRVAAENSDRELTQSFTAGGNTFTADNGYSLETATAIAGFDLFRGDDITFGVHGGVVRSQLSFDGSDTRDEMSGPTAGLYGSWRSGPFSLDGAFNANLLELERTSSTFEATDANVLTLGGRAEAGWKIGGDVFVQPIVTAAYLSSTIDDVRPTGYDITFTDAVSSRAAVGVRVGGAAGPLRAWAVARAWNEFAGDGVVRINNTGTATGVTFADDLSGDFQELGGGLSAGNESGTLSGYVSGGVKLADDIDNYSLSLGLRLRW